MARVTVEDCTDKVPNRFELVALAAQRAKNISAGAPITIERDKRDNDKNAVIALREIAKENLDIEKIREDLIDSLRSKNKIDVMEKEENLFAEKQEDVGDIDYSSDSPEFLVSDSHSDLDDEKFYSDNITDDETK